MDERNEPTRTAVHNEEDVTKRSDFWIAPEDGIEIPGPGSLDTLLLVGDTSTFGAFIEMDNDVFLQHTFDDLSTFSSEMDHVSTNTVNGSNVIGVSNVPYRDSIRVQATLTETTTFDHIRGIFTIGKDQDY